MSTPDLATAFRGRNESKKDQTPAGNRSFEIDARFGDFCDFLGLDPSDAGGKITLVGEDTILPSRHRLGAGGARRTSSP